MSRKYIIPIINGLMLASLVFYNDCSVTKFLKEYGGSETGNPMVATTQLMFSVCSVLNRCSSQIAISDCLQEISEVPGVNAPLGLPSSNYGTFANILAAEETGAITPEINPTNSCATAINKLSCDDPAVIAAFNRSSPNPYNAVTAMISSQPGTCNDVFSTLQITPMSVALSPSASQFFTATGGTPPYSVSLISGGGAVNAATATYTAPASPTIATVRVTDSLGHTSDTTFTVGTVPSETWLGSVDSNWNTAGNWSQGTVPDQNHLAIFDSQCSTHCNVIMSGPNIDVGGVAIKSDFNGSLTQDPGTSLFVEEFGYTQDGASFIGSPNVTDSITLNGDFHLNNGQFTANAGTLSFQSSNFTISSLANFNHNNGTFLFGTGTSGDAHPIFDMGGSTFYNFHLFQGGAPASITLNSPVNILGTLTLQNFATSINGAGINAFGDVINNGRNSMGGGGSSVITLAGANGQSLSGVAGNWFPSLGLSGQAGETINLTGTIEVWGNWTYTSGVVSSGSSTVEIGRNPDSGLLAQTVSSGSMTFNNVIFSNTSYGITVKGSMAVGGNMTINMFDGEWDYLNGGTLLIMGNLSIPGQPTPGGNLNVVFAGNGSSTFSDASGANLSGIITINKPTGSITLLSDIPWNTSGESLTLQAGTLSLNGFTLDASGNTITLNAGATLNCNGGCGTGTSCGLGLDRLKCASLLNAGTINP